MSTVSVREIINVLLSSFGLSRELYTYYTIVFKTYIKLRLFIGIYIEMVHRKFLLSLGKVVFPQEDICTTFTV